MDSILPPTIPRIHMDTHKIVFEVPERGSCPHSLSTERVRRPRGVTPQHLTLDVWAQIGGKWVLFGPRGRETEYRYLYMGVF